MDRWNMLIDAGVMPDELIQEIPYLMLGYFFGWTSDEVDNTDAERIEKLIILLQQFNKNDANIKGMGGSDFNKLKSNRPVR
jgi:hypothetical protein